MHRVDMLLLISACVSICLCNWYLLSLASSEQGMTGTRHEELSRGHAGILDITRG